MKTTLSILLPLLFASFPLFAQIDIEGELLLGEGDQLLLLETKNGDQFTGYISKWTKDSIDFELITNDLLNFSTQEVKKIKAEEMENVVLDENQDLSYGAFTFYTSDGRVREGQLISLSEKSTRIKYKRTRRAYVATSGLEKITFEPYSDSYNYFNAYRLDVKKIGKIQGSLVHMDEKNILFRPEGQKVYSFPRSKVVSIKQRKAYRPAIGYQQALLLTPTGFNLRKGESEVRSTNFLLNSYTTGINDHISATAGLMMIEPYFKLKLSHDVGEFVHLSLGGGIALSGAAGWHSSISVGTPDNFLNFGYTENKGEVLAGSTDMNAFFAGGSWRVGNRHRLFAEFTHIVEQDGLFDSNGWGSNSVALGYGWFARRVNLNFGLVLAERIYNEQCFSGFPIFTSFPCGEERHSQVPIPVISTSIYFGEMFDKK